jgi:hypothetical protein
MAARKRRGISSFNLAFLDIMFCGFGAVVLLVLLINSNAVQRRKEVFDDLRGEVNRLETQIKNGRKNLVAATNSLEETTQKLVKTKGKSREILAAITSSKKELSDARNQTRAKKKHVRQLQADLKTLDKQRTIQGTRDVSSQDLGRKNLRVSGNGQRQYLTGLRLGGKRVLILLDRSASMLDRSIVNVIRRRNMDDNSKRNAPKWKKARRTVAWILANLPATSKVQVYGFNTTATSVVKETTGKWINPANTKEINQVMQAVNRLIPKNGTSLVNAFNTAALMYPPPDNIILLTDGLPTQGKRKPLRASVSGKARVRLFESAVTVLPPISTVNTILFPMEGDPVAPALFWKLAVDTDGSFLTPTPDWP